MRITIGKVPFDVDPVTRGGRLPARLPVVATALEDRKVYQWDCVTSKGKALEPIDGQGYLAIKSFAAFAEPENRPYFDRPDPTETLKMKTRVLMNIRLRSMADLNIAMGRMMGPNKVTFDLSAYDWLKPLAGFDVWMHVDFHFVELINKVRNLRFLVAIPHRATLRVKMTYMCKPKDILDGLSAGKKADDADLGITIKGTKGSRAIRRAILRDEIRSLQPRPPPSTVEGGSGFDFYDFGKPFGWVPDDEDIAKRKKLEEELKALEEMEGG